MKYKIIIKNILTVSLSFSLGGFTGNFFTSNYYTEKIEAMEQEPRIAVPYNGIAGAYITAPASKADSIRASMEEKKKTQRWKSGRR